MDCRREPSDGLLSMTPPECWDQDPCTEVSNGELLWLLFGVRPPGGECRSRESSSCNQSLERGDGGLDPKCEKCEGLHLEYILKAEATRLAAGTDYPRNVAT